MSNDNVKDIFEAKLEAFESPAKKAGAFDFDLTERALKCGFRDLEKYNYLRAGEPDLVIIGARPGNGKTALLVQLLTNIAKNEAPTLMFSLEMAERALNKRLLAMEAEVNTARIHSISRQKRDLIAADLQNFYIDDTKGLHINELRSRAMAFASKNGVAAVGVDYAQIVGGDRGRSKTEEVLAVIEGLKALANDLNVPVIALCQMSRLIEQRQQLSKSARPVMSDLADCGGIERFADQILFLDRPDKRDPSRVGQLDVYCAKNRHGDTRDLILDVRWEYTKFYDTKESL